MGIFDSIRQSAWKTKVRGELALVDMDIARKEAAFGVEFYDTISAYRNGTNKSLPSICDFFSENFMKTERAIKLLEDEKEIKSMKIRINRSATDTPPDNYISDTANEAILRLQIHSLDRDIAKRKEEFGSSVSRQIAEKARFWSSSGVSARQANDMIAIRKLMEKHSRDFLPLYNDRDSKMRSIDVSEGPVSSPPIAKKATIPKNVSEFESLTRLEHYLERNKVASATGKNHAIKTVKADFATKTKDSAQRSDASPESASKQNKTLKSDTALTSEVQTSRSSQEKKLTTVCRPASWNAESKQLTLSSKTSRPQRGTASSTRALTGKSTSMDSIQREIAQSRSEHKQTVVRKPAQRGNMPISTAPSKSKSPKKKVVNVRVEI